MKTPLVSHCLVFLLAAATFVGIAPPAAAEDLSGIQWVTNTEDPPIGDPRAKKGGTYVTYAQSYPLTFRLVGPDATDSFANWSRAYSIDFRAVRRHPTTDNHIPWMATHWSVQDDAKTIYFKLDPDARWSDGEKVTAEDYVFAFEMMRSEHIIDPFWNVYFLEHYETVEALDEYTVKVVGAHTSWRPLDDFYIFPMPKHATKLGPNWVRETHLQFPIVPGPYVISETVDGQLIKFKRVQNWWGNEKRYFQGLYNVDEIHIKIILDRNRAFDHFKKGELSFYRVSTSKIWAEDTEFESIQNGWVRKKQVFIDFPSGLYGFCMNLERPLFQDKNFRKAIQYGFDFEQLNDEMMFKAYYRMTSCLTGSMFENKELIPYSFDPKKMREHLVLAGYKKRGKDGIFARESDGQRASFTLTYGSPGLTRHMTVAQQTYKRLGIDMKLQLLEGGTAFERRQERSYDMSIISQTTEFFPDPHQYFHSSFVATKNNNNIFAFANEEADKLIDVYRFSESHDERMAAMHRLDELIQDEAFYVPFWQAPFVRMVFWDYLQFPDFIVPKRFEQIPEWQVFWVDQEKKERLANAKARGEAFARDQTIDLDPYGVKARIDEQLGALSN